MTTTPASTIRERLAWEVTPELYQTIRRLWIKHSIAEDQRDLQGLIDTLAEDCVYELMPTGQRWEGHDGARAFYTSFLGAFPDVKFDLRDIVIGPQGVIEVADMTGTHRGEWGGQPPGENARRALVGRRWRWPAGPLRGQRRGGEQLLP